MASSTVEDYLKHIYHEQQLGEGQAVAMGRIANRLKVVPGTTTTMMKSLADEGLVDYEPRVGVRLTEQGEREALQVIRRHRLIELFLQKIVGMDWSEIDAEAERLEHAISDKLLARIDILLGHPSFDPHGDPIPGSVGFRVSYGWIRLDRCAVGLPVRVARIGNQEPAFLQFIETVGLRPGTELVVRAIHPAAQALLVGLPEGREVALGLTAAAWIEVQENQPDPPSPVAGDCFAPVQGRPGLSASGSEGGPRTSAGGEEP